MRPAIKYTLFSFAVGCFVLGILFLVFADEARPEEVITRSVESREVICRTDVKAALAALAQPPHLAQIIAAAKDFGEGIFVLLEGSEGDWLLLHLHKRDDVPVVCRIAKGVSWEVAQ